MVLHSAFTFLIALILVLTAAVLFTNGVEWLGRHLKLTEGAVGSVLAAVGTAMPETIIPVVAIVWMGNPEEVDVGLGAIVGAPFMLACLTLPLTGLWIQFLSSLRQRTNAFQVSPGVPATDLAYFLPAFSLAIMASVVPLRVFHILVGIVLLAVYVRYLKSILAEGELSEAPIGPLYLARWSTNPPMWAVLTQIVLALAVMVGGAHLFVDAVKEMAPVVGIPPLILSLLLTPVATELPEKFNSLVWVAQKKDTLAIGNITGAMVFQGTIPVSIGLFFTSWELGRSTLVCAVLATVTALVYYLLIRKFGMWRPWHLAVGGLTYIGFGIYVWTLL